MSLSELLVNMILDQFAKRPEFIAVFGAGQNGILLSKYLVNSGVQLDFFCDNDTEKHGTLIDGVRCVSFSELCKYKTKCAVFVSPYQADEIINELKMNNFVYVVPKDFLKMMRFVPHTESEEDIYQKLPYFGHFYSLYPNIDEVLERSHEVFDPEKEISDIDFYEENQLSILNQMVNLYSSLPKWEEISVQLGSTSLRYRMGNPSLSAGDAVGLHCMLRIIKPKKMIEVGSGYTSAVTLDTNEFYLNNEIELTFIEPYPDLLRSVLKENDRINLIVRGLQDVPLEVFGRLESGDILFIDSTHVSKVNSDVNYLFFEIFPRLKKGVYIHLHDIFYPFEYPKEWIVSGMIWNELYLLRAFLQNNTNYSIVFFQSMMEQKHLDVFLNKWPLGLPIQGGSIWIKKEN